MNDVPDIDALQPETLNLKDYSVRDTLVLLGLAQPWKRGALACALAGGTCYACKFPSYAFDEEKRMRLPSAFFAGPDTVALHKHFLVLPLAVGAAFFLFT